LSRLVRSLALLVVLAGPALPSPARAVEGNALEWGTHRAIPGAVMTLECRRSKGFEGTELAHSLVSTTDRNGRYQFSLWSYWYWWDCVQRRLGGYKEGYVHVGSNNANVDLYADITSIPTIEYFMKESEWTPMEMLRLGTEASQFKVTGNPVELPRAYYANWLNSFRMARKVAKSAADIDFLRKTFCPPLLSNYDELTPDKDLMRKLRAEHVDERSLQTRAIKTTEFDAEVLPVCGSP
jgi:hypothetical protein